jgi:hypothetical protein
MQLEHVRSPHVQGVAPRSVYGAGEDARAIAIAREAAKGNIRPLPVIAARRVIGVVGGREAFSDETQFTPLRHGARMSELRRTIADMIDVQRDDSIWRARQHQELMPVTDANQISDSMSNGKSGATFFSKTPSAAMIANNWYDYWPLAGSPNAGGIAGTARTAQRWDDTSTGALNHRGNVSTDTKHTASLMMINQANTPLTMPYDRVGSWDACSFTTSNQTFTNTLSPQRYNAGAPGLLPVMVTNTVLSATATNLMRFAYTDQGGTTAQLMPTGTTVSAIVSAAAPTTTLGARVIAPSTSANTFPWIFHLPLASGDSGMRVPEDYTWSAANTGTFTLIGMYPFGYILNPVAAIPAEKDFIYQMPALERMYDGACVSFMAFVPAATAIAIAQGRLSFLWHS